MVRLQFEILDIYGTIIMVLLNDDDDRDLDKKKKKMMIVMSIRIHECKISIEAVP